jgi:protocatechuate 3,4-dioxygenase alpha subunit
MTYARTPSQTIGPFFTVAIPRRGEEYVVPAGTPGAFWLRGRVLDGAGDPVGDAMIETWQASVDGAFPAGDSPAFRGFGRSATDVGGRFGIHTVKPGRLTGADGSPGAPHLAVAVFARGLLRQLMTRVYFGDEAEANRDDPVLSSIADEARETLIARPDEDGYTIDIRLQGERETVFFDF